MVSLFDFPNQIELLKRLFNSSATDLVSPKLERMNEIFNVSMKAWENNLTRLPEVKYVIFSEAAPWTKSGPVRHFYQSFDGALSNKVWTAFFNCSKPEDVETGLQRLAARGLLLIDSLPFAMKYTSAIRNHSLYGALIKESAPLLLERINNPRIKWAKDVKGAFAFRLNGKRVMDAFPEGIRLPTKQILLLDDKRIAADQSGYPNSAKIRKILGIRDRQTQ